MDIGEDGNFDERLTRDGIHYIADCLGEGMAVVQDDVVVFCNERLAEIVDIPVGQIINSSLSDLIPPNSSFGDYPEARRRREAGPAAELDQELHVHNTYALDLYLRNRVTRVSWGGKPATLHFLEDISRRKTTDRRLREQTEMNGILANTVRRILASPFSLEDTASTVLESSMSLTGSRAGVLVVKNAGGDQLLERHCAERYPSCVLPQLMDSIMADSGLMDKRRPGRIDGAFYLNEEIAHMDSTYPAVGALRNVLRVPVLNESPFSAQIILADSPDMFGPWDLDNMEKIAEVLSLALVRMSTVEELRAAKEEAEKEAEARSLFLANVSHEVRSPLNGVLMMASLLADTDLTEEQAELLGVVTFSARTIDRLIRDLTDLTQIRTGHFTVHREEFDADELCRAILESNRPEALRKSLGVEYFVMSDEVHCIGDRERIGQIVANLVSNAIKYTERGRIRLEIGVGSDRLRIIVSDTGVGIPRGMQDSVFHLYRRGGREYRRRAEGSGIGLAVVKELTEEMGGRISLESEPGKGSRFEIILPFAAGNRDESGDAAEGIMKPDESLCILLAEDEGVNRLYLKTVLEREGWTVDEAVDGVEAVAMANRREYDLILMDIDMPMMDGLEATFHIRKRQPFIPIVAITAHAYQDDRTRILEAGINDIILKPIRESGLLQRLRSYVRSA